MNRARWAYLKQLAPSRGDYLHISCRAEMITKRSPAGVLLPPIPWIQRPGDTYNVGRNKAKRALRVGPRKCWHVLAKAGAL